MLSRPKNNPFKTTIKFTVSDMEQYNNGTKEKDGLIEMFTPAMLQTFAHNVGGMLQSFSIKYLINSRLNIFGSECSVTLLTANEVTLPTLKSQLEFAITISQRQIFEDKQLSFKLLGDIEITNVPNDNLMATYKGKVKRRTFGYNAINMTDKTTIEFVDESAEVNQSIKPRETRYEYDPRGNVIAYSYTYTTLQPAPSSRIDLLRFLSDVYLQGHPDCVSFHNAIVNNDYNQALRKACAAGNYELAFLLFKGDENHELNIDINQPSLNGYMPLDYAYENTNTDLITHLLKLGAKSRYEHRKTALVDTERAYVTRANASRGVYHGHGVFDAQQGSDQLDWASRFPQRLNSAQIIASLDERNGVGRGRGGPR